jgi:hypothetical protein
MVPITTKPAERDDPILATPWATNSALLRCLRPVIHRPPQLDETVNRQAGKTDGEGTALPPHSTPSPAMRAAANHW